MNEHWKELLPIDEYIVCSNGILHEFDRKVLTLLYQPLIGALCYSLYMTLWGEINVDRLWGNKNTHYYLMSMMQVNLRAIYKERKKLEGIGLLKTYVKKEDEERTFIYELQPPLPPDEFFNDGMLNVYLYNRLGKTNYLKLKKFFSDEKLEYSTFKEITSPFNEVFSSLKPSELITSDKEMEDALHLDANKQYMQREKEESIYLPEQLFDFSLFLAGISESLISKDAFTPNVREVIGKLAFLYNIDPIEMKKVVLQALDENDQINVEQLRKAARDYYQFTNGDALPTLVERTQPLSERSTENEKAPSNKEEQLIQYLDRVSPYQVLVDISGGVEPSVADLQIIENVMMNQKLYPGVVNVLIHYVMLKTDMKLSKNYVEKIASHWARKKIKTVKQAMNLAKEEHRQYQEWASKKQQTEKKDRPTYKKGSISNRRQLMLGMEPNETKKEKETSAISEDYIKKSMQKMFEQLEGKEE